MAETGQNSAIISVSAASADTVTLSNGGTAKVLVIDLTGSSGYTTVRGDGTAATAIGDEQYAIPAGGWRVVACNKRSDGSVRVSIYSTVARTLSVEVIG